LRKLHVPVRHAQPFVMAPGFSHPLLRLDREDLPVLLTRPAQLEEHVWQIDMADNGAVGSSEVQADAV
jgi:hypothetical protein